MIRPMKSISFVLEPIVPFWLALTVRALRRRDDNLVERWDEETCVERIQQITCWSKNTGQYFHHLEVKKDALVGFPS